MNNKDDTLPNAKMIPSEESGPYYESECYPECGGYYHICPFTGREFFGRKKQIYPDAKTKSRAAAEKRSEIHQQFGPGEKAARKNWIILEKLYNSGAKIAHEYALLALGFDFNAPCDPYQNFYKLIIKFYHGYGLYRHEVTFKSFLYNQMLDVDEYQYFDGDKVTVPEKKVIHVYKDPNTSIL